MLKKILVCLDGTRFSEGILPYAIERAQHFNSKLLLLKVSDMISAAQIIMPGMPGMPGQSLMIDQGSLDRMIREEVERDRAYLGNLTASLRNIGLDADYLVLHRHAGISISDAILNYIEDHDFDLLMMATHGHSFWKRLMFGSVTEFVIRKSPLPVFVVSPQSGETKESIFGEMPQFSPVG